MSKSLDDDGTSGEVGIDSGNTGDRDRGRSIHFEIKRVGRKEARHSTDHEQALVQDELLVTRKVE